MILRTLTRAFTRLWLAQAISKFGSGITGSALPLAAVMVLDATPAQMGLLAALGMAPLALIGLVAGAWVDRVRRRPLMVAADVGRAILLGSIPAAYLLGALRFEHLLVVAPLAGTLTVVFDISYQSLVPELVGRDQLLRANSRLATVDATAEITTPGLAGIFVQAIGAPFAILLDAASFVASAVLVALVDVREAARRPTYLTSSLRREIADGLRAVMSSPMLRSVAAFNASRTFFGSFIGALYALYALRELGLDPILLGITIGVGGASNLVGTTLVEPVTRRFGVGPTMLGAMVVGSIAVYTLPLAGGPVLLAFAILVIGQASDAIHPLFDVNALSLRQSIAPERVLGRVNATMHVIDGGLAPIGALVGGFLGGVVGTRETLLIAALGCSVSLLWLIFSPLRRLRDLPSDIVGSG
ncbi:MAG: MFS transporter [Chloroflexi bacterium]|nr:MFS transporter [Chloroflexota bacterium]